MRLPQPRSAEFLVQCKRSLGSASLLSVWDGVLSPRLPCMRCESATLRLCRTVGRYAQHGSTVQDSGCAPPLRRHSCS